MIFSRIKALYFAVEFVISILFVILFMWLFPSHNHKVRRIWAKTQRFLGFYKIEVIGKPDDDTQIVLMNHLSMLDIVVMEETYPKNLCWIAKKEIGDIPIIGKILKLPKMIPVDRSNKRGIATLIKEVDDRVKNGRIIAIFPEGTRGNGKEILSFKGGAKIIVEKLNLKAQPVMIINSNILNSKNFSFKNGTIKIIYLPSIDTSDENWPETTRKQMQKILDEHNAADVKSC